VDWFVFSEILIRREAFQFRAFSRVPFRGDIAAKVSSRLHRQQQTQCQEPLKVRDALLITHVWPRIHYTHRDLDKKSPAGDEAKLI
jgi:hypothetical protein